MPARPRAIRRIAALTALAAVTGAAASCDSPTSPEDMAGLYVLERTGAGPFPGDWKDLGTFSLKPIAETLYLRAGRVGEQVRVYSVTEDATPADTMTYREASPFEYGLKGYQVTFRFRDFDETGPATGGFRTDIYSGNAIISNGGYVYAYRGRLALD